MQLNTNLFGRVVKVMDPTNSGESEFMIFQGITSSKYGDILHAICMNAKGEIGSYLIDHVTFVDCEKETTDILRYSLKRVPDEMFEDVGLIGRDDIYDDQYKPVKIVNRGRDIIGYSFEGEPKYEYYVVDGHSNTYSLGHLYWKGDKE